MRDETPARLVTPVTELLGTRFPIVQGGMIWTSGWKLASAVSSAGGLGVIGAGSMDPSLLEEHISKLTASFGGPYGVNFPVSNRRADEFARICVDREVPVVITSAGSPRKYTAMLKRAGAVVIHVVPSVSLALKVEAAGCDMVVAEGIEAGGHNGFQEITSMVLWPSVVDAVEIPVIAAGGISDGRGVAAALAMGAGGVQIGTRFAMCEESSAHESYKRAVMESGEAEARLYLRSYMPTRALENQYVSEAIDAERSGAAPEKLGELRGAGRSRLGIFEGDLKEGELEVGQVASRVDDVVSARQVVADLIDDYRVAISRLP